MPISCTATLSIFHPASLTIFAAAANNFVPLAPFHSGLSVPKFEPKSPKPAADKSASAQACATTSPSECPAKPVSLGQLIPAKFNSRPFSKG